MSLSKSQMKLAVVNDIGNRFDDLLESATGQQQQCLGAKAAAGQIASNVKKLIGIVEQDFEKGDIETAIKDGDLAVLKLIKTYLSRAISACEATTDHFENLRQISVGKVEAYQQSVKLLKKMHDNEQTKIDQVIAAIETGSAQVDGPDVVLMDNSVRPTGVRPVGTLKQQRLAEELASQKPNGKKKRVSKKKSNKSSTAGTR